MTEAPGFDPKAVFSKLDKYHKNSITVEEIKTFLMYLDAFDLKKLIFMLRENNVVATEEEVLEFINSFDRNQTGHLGMTE